MKTRLLPALLAGSAAVVALAGCASHRAPVTATTLEPSVLSRIARRVVEPGFSPEMVYLALGKPTFPADGLVDSATNGTWVYENLSPRELEFLRAGFCRQVVFDSTRQREVVVTKRADTPAGDPFAADSLVVSFRDARVVQITRVAEI
jgi:hypothetical protein